MKTLYFCILLLAIVAVPARTTAGTVAVPTVHVGVPRVGIAHPPINRDHGPTLVTHTGVHGPLRNGAATAKP
jgi:hypothetical protein